MWQKSWALLKEGGKRGPVGLLEKIELLPWLLFRFHGQFSCCLKWTARLFILPVTSDDPSIKMWAVCSFTSLFAPSRLQGHFKHSTILHAGGDKERVISCPRMSSVCRERGCYRTEAGGRGWVWLWGGWYVHAVQTVTSQFSLLYKVILIKCHTTVGLWRERRCL